MGVMGRAGRHVAKDDGSGVVVVCALCCLWWYQSVAAAVVLKEGRSGRRGWTVAGERLREASAGLR